MPAACCLLPARARDLFNQVANTTHCLGAVADRDRCTLHLWGAVADLGSDPMRSNVPGRCRAALGQRASLGRHHGEDTALATGACRLDGRVEG
jgi:hypothetical protein